MKGWIALIVAALGLIVLIGAALLDLKETADNAVILQAELEQETQCHDALTRDDRWQISVSCSVEVKTLVAELDAMEVRAVAAEDQLDAIRDDEADAIGRAEARTRTLEEGRRHAADVFDSAPRDDGGFVHLDSGRLRQLREGFAPDRPQ